MTQFALYSVYMKGQILMEFKINNNTWKILEKDSKTLVDAYNSEYESQCTFVFGMTKYSKHEIWINDSMIKEQKINTLKHELTHSYIFSYGLYNIPNFNEEMVCDLVSSINDFINDVVSKYKNYLDEK